MRYELSNYEWSAIKPMLPNKPRGVRRVNDRRVPKHTAQRHLPNTCLSWESLCAYLECHPKILTLERPRTTPSTEGASLSLLKLAASRNFAFISLAIVPDSAHTLR